MQAINYGYLEEEKQWMVYLLNFSEHWAQGKPLKLCNSTCSG
jgi:hypothetical protein